MFQQGSKTKCFSCREHPALLPGHLSTLEYSRYYRYLNIICTVLPYNILPYNSSSTAANAITSKKGALDNCSGATSVGRRVLLTTSLELLEAGMRAVPSCRSEQGITVAHKILLYLKCWEKIIWCFLFPTHPMLCLVTTALFLFLWNVFQLQIHPLTGSTAWLQHTSLSHAGKLEATRVTWSTQV